MIISLMAESIKVESPSSAGPTAPPVAVLPGAEVTVAAVGTVELHLWQVVGFTSAEREHNNKVWTLYTEIANYFIVTHQQLKLHLVYCFKTVLYVLLHGDTSIQAHVTVFEEMNVIQRK